MSEIDILFHRYSLKIGGKRSSNLRGLNNSRKIVRLQSIVRVNQRKNLLKGNINIPKLSIPSLGVRSNGLIRNKLNGNKLRRNLRQKRSLANAGNLRGLGGLGVKGIRRGLTVQRLGGNLVQRRVLGRKILGRKILGQKIIGRKVLGRKVLGHKVIARQLKGQRLGGLLGLRG